MYDMRLKRLFLDIKLGLTGARGVEAPETSKRVNLQSQNLQKSQSESDKVNEVIIVEGFGSQVSNLYENFFDER